MSQVRVLIVDDSATMRQLIRFRLRADPRIEVVGEASDTAQAREALDTLSPDVMTLDVEMPGQSGLDFLREVMRSRPMPVIMVSTETEKGSAAAVEALSRGAIDCVGKPRSREFNNAFGDLARLVHGAATARVQPRGAAEGAQPPVVSRDFQWNGMYVLIGSSTGGVDALERIIAGMPANCPPILITQHMSDGFLASFAERINSRYAPRVELARSDAPVEQGRIYLAPGGEQHLTMTVGARPRCRLIGGEKVSSHRPSVDVLFNSALPLGNRVCAALLTGMGSDGADGMLALRRAGATCLAQDEASSVVWGMPRIAWEQGAAHRLVPLKRMASEILDATDRRGRMSRAPR
ncbi:two-component system, chemotaxis family, response regulator CheB [Paracoccus isoporae]|uniref:Protein-glutamate methylesterase/protein-glutamine glutaminase n=1 Tax=Paracoccus isoporae TaxID=591205 RepID=A0A1G6XDS6_9RHOB|nr:chemotaxis response regulator protein-glutamate methylesterase [Paracoccus isoporae]SDD76369.1 two-component system, chemotaxis family, response regulator CheB [Paracoccus isoporae]